MATAIYHHGVLALFPPSPSVGCWLRRDTRRILPVRMQCHLDPFLDARIWLYTLPTTAVHTTVVQQSVRTFQRGQTSRSWNVSKTMVAAEKIVFQICCLVVDVRGEKYRMPDAFSVGHMQQHAADSGCYYVHREDTSDAQRGTYDVPGTDDLRHAPRHGDTCFRCCS